MAAIEPVVEFGKNADDFDFDSDYDISYSFVGKAPTLGSPGVVNGNPISGGDQTENWINKNSQVAAESEQSYWDQTALDVYNPAPPDPNFIDSGCGLIDSGATSKDIIRGQVSRVENIRIYNNRAGQWRTGPLPGDQQVAAGENCRLVLYDNPSVDTQTDEPITALDGAGDALFWTHIEQINYYYWNGAAWALPAPAETNGPVLLGFNGGAPLAVSSLVEPHKTLGGALQGVNSLRVGHTIAGSAFLGTRQTVVGGYKDAEGGYIHAAVQWWVPENSSAKFHSIALAIEYTFVLE